MSVAAANDREQLLEQYGRYYGHERFAVTFTASTSGEDAKRVTTSGWDTTRPLATADLGAGLIGERGKTRNVAIVLRPSNLVVLECDTEDDLLRIEELGLPVTLTVRSSKPYKRHFYFRPPEALAQLPFVAFRFESGKLTADTGRYFLAPPSIHPTGAIYAFLPGLGPDDVDIAELPEETYRVLTDSARTENAEQAHRIEFDPGFKVQAGQRGDSVFRMACQMRRWGWDRGEILQASLRWNEKWCDPPIERARVETQVDGAMKKRGGQELERAHANPLPDEPDPEPQVEPQGGSWRRVNLADPRYLIPPDPPRIAGLLYAGKRHVLSGAQESAKTLIAYHLLLKAHRDQLPVAIVDFEMGPTAANLMLRDLGATEQEIQDIYYTEPQGPPNDEALDAIAEHGTRYALIDAAAGAFDLTGLDDNSRKDAETFARLWIRPLWQRGVATLLLDHVTKDKEARGKYAIGSERKTGGADIHLGFDSLKALSRGGSGMVKVTVHKDRPGFLQRPTAAMLDLTSAPDTHAITVTVRDAHPTDDQGAFRPTIYMERVSRELEKHPGEQRSRAQIEEAVKGKRDYVRDALAWLLEDGHITESVGARQARLYTLLKPYIKPPDDLAPTSPPPRPGEVPVTSPDLAPPRPPLTGGEGEDGGHGKDQGDNDLAPTEGRHHIDVHDPAVQALLDDDIPF